MPKRTLLLVLFWFALISFGILLPSGLFSSTTVPGHEDSDIYNHLWILDWVKTSVVTEGQFPLSVKTLNFPNGGKLVPADLINSLVSIPLQEIFPLPIAYSIVMALGLIFSGICFFILAHYMTGSIWAGIVSGTGFLLMPYTTSYAICSGVPEVNTAGFFPLLLYFLFRTIREASWKYGLLTSLSILLLAVNAFHSVVMVSVAIALFGFYYLVFVRDPNRDIGFLPSAKSNTTSRFSKKILWPVLISGILGAALAIPYLLMVKNSIESGESQIPNEAIQERYDPGVQLQLENYHPDSKVPYFTPLTDYLVPGKNRPMIMDEITRFYHCAYLGLTLIALAIWGGIKGRNRFGIFLILLTLLAMVLSTGPNLVIARSVGFSSPLNLIFLLFYYAYPLFRIMMEPLRFAFLAGTCVYLLAANGVALTARGKHRHLIGAGCTVLVMLDLILLSPVPFPYPSTKLQVPKVYQTIESHPGDFGVLELPFWVKGSALMPRERFYYQTIHRKPIADNISGHMAPYLLSNSFTSRLLEMEAPYRYPITKAASQDWAAKGINGLTLDGFRFILVNQDLYTPKIRKNVRALFDEFLQAPVKTDGTYTLYDLTGGNNE